MRAPILLVHDMDDDVIDPAQSRAIAAAYGPQARLIETTGLGHSRILADPDVIASAVEFAVSGAAPVPSAAPAVARRA